jgi:lysophospholipase L1-like esterase
MALAFLSLAAVTNVRCARLNAAQPALSYVAFGDSFAAWETATGYGYTKSFKDSVAADRGTTVRETNLAHAGDYSADMRAVIRQPAARTALRTADIVTWNIGMNDFDHARSQYQAGTCGGADNQDCLRRAVTTFSANWDAIVSTLDSTPHKPAAVFLTMDVMYRGGAADDPSFAVTNPYLDQMNAHIRSTATFAPVANVRVVFNGPRGTGDPNEPRPAAPGGLLLPDGHPNRDGAEAIGMALRDIEGDSRAADRRRQTSHQSRS